MVDIRGRGAGTGSSSLLSGPKSNICENIGHASNKILLFLCCFRWLEYLPHQNSTNDLSRVPFSYFSDKSLENHKNQSVMYSHPPSTE